MYFFCFLVLFYGDFLIGRLSIYFKFKLFFGVVLKDDEKVFVNWVLYIEMLGILICEEF